MIYLVKAVFRQDGNLLTHIVRCDNKRDADIIVDEMNNANYDNEDYVHCYIDEEIKTEELPF